MARLGPFVGLGAPLGATLQGEGYKAGSRLRTANVEAPFEPQRVPIVQDGGVPFEAGEADPFGFFASDGEHHPNHLVPRWNGIPKVEDPPFVKGDPLPPFSIRGAEEFEPFDSEVCHRFFLSLFRGNLSPLNCLHNGVKREVYPDKNQRFKTFITGYSRVLIV